MVSSLSGVGEAPAVGHEYKANTWIPAYKRYREDDDTSLRKLTTYYLCSGIGEAPRHKLPQAISTTHK
ncbi:hypothetical protein [Shewanella litoralis]|uniref:Uncharacterized protein n=1 Tax=Shewanella litoralis TaxID=2282700 RepID=A0ABQ2RFH1_9GAMM|nr:hypothetical protein [Shewanella litoralis]GGQ29469.1 hypothetical protein GCM10009411_31440 [Shewanella litoralis]